MRNLLIYRLLIVNAIGLMLLAAAAMEGFVGMLLKGDISHVIYVIVALFIVGLGSVFVRARKVSSALNDIKAGKSVVINGPKFLEKNAHIEDICTWLVTLSLLGNIIGFAIAVSGQHDLSSSEGLLRLANQFMSGMVVAFFTTIAGLIFALWLDINRRVLKTATVAMLEDCRGKGAQ
ncbi:MAG: hypothetical protein KGL39_46210 [Patescibacteria group bacterium]|nr:hypothetical protein [Patescibacteria group bacterium]